MCLPFGVFIHIRILSNYKDCTSLQQHNPLTSTIIFHCSCIKITFSTPFTMKYPPGSYGHSFIWANSRSDLFRNKHFDERNMIGIRPITTFFLTTICRPRVYRTLTYMGALYVQSRNRHWKGVVCVVAYESSSMLGSPTQQSV